MGVHFPRLELAETSFITSLYQYETVQKKLADSDVWFGQDSMFPKSLCLVNYKGPGNDCRGGILKVLKKYVQMVGPPSKQIS